MLLVIMVSNCIFYCIFYLITRYTTIDDKLHLYTFSIIKNKITPPVDKNYWWISLDIEG